LKSTAKTTTEPKETSALNASSSKTTLLCASTNVLFKTRKVPDAYINKEANFVTQEFLDYARPLIGEQLPTYARLKKDRIKKVLPNFV
jgi:hypothetical protein